MIVSSGDGQMPVTFGFVVNWEEPVEEFPAVEAAFFASIKNTLTVIKEVLQ